MLKTISLAAALAMPVVPAAAQDANWHLVSVDDSGDPVAWFLSDKVEPADQGRKKISYALVMAAADADMYDVAEGGWIRYHVLYDCKRKLSGTTAIDKMARDGTMVETRSVELRMSEIYDGDAGKYFRFVCENRWNSKLRASTKNLSSAARPLLAETK